MNPYIPDFKRGIDHFCIHAGIKYFTRRRFKNIWFYYSFNFHYKGGRGVIDGIEKNLSLTPAHVAASRHALYT